MKLLYLSATWYVTRSVFQVGLPRGHRWKAAAVAALATGTAALAMALPS